MLTNREIRQRTRAQVKGNFWKIFLALLLCNIITGVGSIVVMGTMATGVAIYMTKFVRRGETNIDYLFRGFRDFGGTFLLGLVHSLIIIAIVVVPTIMYFVSIATFIASGGTDANVGFMIVSIIIMLAGLVAVVIVGFMLAPIYYIKSAQPQLKTKEILRTSREVMKGNKGKLFGLYLSYIWIIFVIEIVAILLMTATGMGDPFWGILVMMIIYPLTFVVVFILVVYVQVATANFFVTLLIDKEIMEPLVEEPQCVEEVSHDVFK